MPHQKFVKDLGLVGLTNLTIALKGLAILPIITKTLGAEAFGTWAQIVVTISLVTPIATLGLPFTLVRFLDTGKKKEEIQEGIYSVLSIIFLVSSVISLVLIGFSGPISTFFGGSEPFLIKILAFVILLECLNLVLLNVFRALQEVGKYSLFMISQTLGEVGLVAATIYFGFGLKGAVFSLLIARSVVFLAMGYLVIQRIGLKIPNFAKLKEYLSFGLPTIPTNLSSWVIRSSNRYLISYFLGTLFVGYYTPGYALGYLINLFVVPIGVVLPAVLSKFYDERKVDKVKLYLRYTLKYFLAIAIPATFGLAILSKQLLTLFSTPEIAIQSYPVIPFVATSIVLFGLYAVFGQALLLVKKTAITGSVWAASAVLNLGLNFLLIPKMGILGAATATLLAYAFAFVLIQYYSLRELRFTIDWRFVLKSILASTVMALLVLKLNPHKPGEILITVVTAASIYLLLLFLLRGFEKREVESFRRLLQIKP